MIVSFLSQKGGVGKSTLARGIAVEFAKNSWDVHVADMDFTQQSTANWAARREAIDINPPIDVGTYRRPDSAIKASLRCDLLVIDGTPYATDDTKEIAKASDLVTLPTGVTRDDLQPALTLAQELTMQHGVSRSKILMVVMKVPENGDKEARDTIATIKEWGFDCIEVWMPFKISYGQAMDAGYSMSETRFNSLNLIGGKILSSIASKIADNSKTEESVELFEETV